MNRQHCSGFISLLGRPNSGKSTLLNKLVGQKIAITSDKPQTTRNRIRGVLTGEGWQIVFLDTPGIHKPKDKLGEQMVKTALDTLAEVDVIYYLLDASVPFGGGDAYIIKKLAPVKTPVFLLLNKIDLLDKPALLPLIDDLRRRRDWQEIIPVSALYSENLDNLLAATRKYLPPGPQYYPPEDVTDQPEQRLAEELIREKVLSATYDEIPHAVAVSIETMEPRSDGLLYIGATVYVERESQKGIVIGKKGSKLKRIGSESRQEIEGLLGSKVFLDLRVKARPNWRNREESVRLTMHY